MLLLEDGHCLRDHALEACHLGIKEVSSPIQATSLHTIVQMVASNIGITLLPQMAINTGITQGLPIRLIPIEAMGTGREIALTWRRGAPRIKEYQHFASLMAGFMGSTAS